MEITRQMKKIISKDPTLCDYWAGGVCHYPEGFRKSNKSKNYPDCNSRQIGVCEKCKPDSVLYESRPSYYEENK